MTVELPRVDGGWRTILCDPPWHYDALSHLSRAPDRHYETMSLNDIRSLEIGKLSSFDAHLWLWTTNNHIHDALHLIGLWGFEFKTMATWVKNKIGVGIFLRGQTEQLLFATRGEPTQDMAAIWRGEGTGWSTLIDAPVTVHSRKPPIVYAMIESLSKPPRLELFARRRRQGWSAWGNEVESGIQNVFTAEI